MFAGSTRFFVVGMRDRTTMTATIAVDDFDDLDGLVYLIHEKPEGS